MGSPHTSRSAFAFAFALLGALSLSGAGCGEPEAAPPASDDAIQQVYAGKLTLSQAQSFTAAASCRW